MFWFLEDFQQNIIPVMRKFFSMAAFRLLLVTYARGTSVNADLTEQLFSDTETRENFPQQIITGKFAGDCRQVLLGEA